MSVQRVVVPLTAPSAFVFRFASPGTACPFRPCQHVVRSFSSSPLTRTSLKRKMQTSTAYNPRTLDIPPPPPRNTVIQDTFISSGIPQVHNIRPPKQPGHVNPVSSRVAAERQNISFTEQEAQKSKTTQAEPQPRTKPRSKLRARKAAMTLTPNAVKHIRALLDQPEPKLIKVGVRNRGCSGLTYHLEYVEKPGMFDEEVEQDGVKVLIDSKALFSIIGSEMDWVEDKLNQRFVFNNPNTSVYSVSIVWPIYITNQVCRGAVRLRRIFYGMTTGSRVYSGFLAA